MADPCRCGHTGDGEHPCHGQAYTCRTPARMRFIPQKQPYSIAGMQPKMVGTLTWACDACWEAYTRRVTDG